jgi:hypothetical protein
MFFERAKAWEILDKRLTHSAGIVFCHMKSPIHSINALAHELAELCKQECREHGERNLFAYQVLESFDHIGRPLSRKFLQERYPFLGISEDGREVNGLVMNGESMGCFRRSFHAMKDHFPRRKLHQIASLIMTSGDHHARVGEIAQEAQDSMDAPAAKAAPDKLLKLQLVPGALAGWYHIAELWDYIPEVNSNETPRT